jgi:predicted nucleic acid-binding protein
LAVLDADFIISALNGHEPAAERLQRLLEEGEPLAVTPVTAFEVLRGAQPRGGVRLDRAAQLLSGFAVLEFDLAAALAASRVAEELAAIGRPMGVADTMTAGIVIRHGERLITRDAAFAHVRGLRVERY